MIPTAISIVALTYAADRFELQHSQLACARHALFRSCRSRVFDMHRYRENDTKGYMIEEENTERTEYTTTPIIQVLNVLCV